MATFSENIHIDGTLSARVFVPPASSIGDSHVVEPGGSGTPIAATKVYHQHREIYNNGTGKVATNAVSEGQVIHVAKAAGSVKEFKVGAVTAHIGAATCTFDLKKNGASILTGTFNTTSADAAYAMEAGTISGAAYVAGDVFSVHVTATAGGGTLAIGVFGYVDFYEKPE